MPPRKRDWTPGTYQLGYFVRDPRGTVLEGVLDRADVKKATQLIKLMLGTDLLTPEKKDGA
jgi:hypothetical protein